MPPSDGAMLALLDAGIDWDLLRARAQQEKAASVVVKELGRLGWNSSDPGYRDLQQVARVAVMQMLQLERLLHQAVDTLHQQGIEAMLLKGAGLGYTSYPSFADRPMGDLDLLVRAEHAERAWTALQQSGWTWPSERWARGHYTSHQHLPPLLREPGGFRLEIHGELLPAGHPFNFSSDTLWDRARRMIVEGRTLIIPHAVHQLWHTCVHFAWSHQMQWGSWRALRDGAALCSKGGIDWGEFVRLARESLAGTCCYWTLRLARGLAGADVPADVLTALRPPRSVFMLEQLERHFVASLFPSPDRCPSIWLSQRLWEAGLIPVWSGHGSARPWQAEERWVAGGEPDMPAAPRRRDLIGRLRHVGAWFGYLRRVHRFVLPSNTAPRGH